MRFMEDVRLLATCLLHSFRFFSGALVLLSIFVYIFSVGFTQAALFYRLDHLNHNPNSTGAVELETHFGNVLRSMLSCFGALAGGVDWIDLANPLIEHISPLFGIFFFIFVFTAVMLLMNVLTAIFVQAASERSTS